MDLKCVEINNFRSIKKYTFSFEHNFQILVGLNESGKSNLIKALSFLNPETPFSVDDIRDPSHDEEEVNEAGINFVYRLNKKECKDLYETEKKKFLVRDLNKKYVKHENINYSIEDFFCFKNEALYCVDIKVKTRKFRFYAIYEKAYSVSSALMKVKDGSTYEFSVGSKSYSLSNYNFVDVDDFSIPPEHLEVASAKDINQLVGLKNTDFLKKNLDTCIIWSYKEENLLPEKIPFSAFATDPSICAPLKNMFSLAKISDIPKCLAEAKEKKNGLRNIFMKVSENTTVHMKKVWPEWKNQRVSIILNGDSVETGIEDEYNVYSLSRRSDGFKRFFTFLLMISARNKTDEIRNNILLIDEPDICIHPSGIQYLRDELIKIGLNNKVLVSTHSIFMIDKDVVDRHYIVEKENEETKIVAVSGGNIVDEEVIYKALGFSLYEILKEKNIIFEGWRDKKLFETFVRSNEGKKCLGSIKVNQIGLLHAVGVKDIYRVANTCENFSREYVIITDSDRPAKEQQGKFDGKGKWYCLDGIEGINAISTEDFVNNIIINKSIKNVLSHKRPDLSFQIENDVEIDKIAKIQAGISALGVDKEECKKLLNSIKEGIAISATGKDFHDSYHLICKSALSEIFPKAE